VLTAIAKLWIVDDPLDTSDAIVVLAGGVQYRAFAAAQLYHAGLADRLLVAKGIVAPTDQLGLTISETELTVKVLLSQGVPNDRVVLVGNGVTSTYGDAVAVREWARDRAAKRVIVPTDIFHTRRVRWIFRKVLREAGTAVLIKAIDPPGYTASDWWRHEGGLITFQNEVIKSLYYALRH
jgi:uncharacterized SAM-binding protein YcdF (DUF218 family)